MAWLDDLLTWASTQRERRISTTTLTEYSRNIRAFAQWYEAGHGRPFSPDQVTVVDADSWLRSQLARGLKPGTVNCNLVALKLMAEWSTSVGIAPINVLSDLCPLPNERTNTTAWLQPLELLVLYRVVRLYPYWSRQRRARVDVILKLMAEVGLSVEETSRLRLDDLDWQPTRLAIAVRAPGGGRRTRVPDGPRKALVEWLSLRSDKNSPWLFGVRRSERMGPWSISQLVRTVADWSGLIGVTPQVLRTTYHHRLWHMGNNPD